MIEPMSAFAAFVATTLLSKALEKVGENIGESTWNKGEETIQNVRKVVEAKLQATGTSGVLARAEAKPTQSNTQILQAELVTQMEEDQAFFNQLHKLIKDSQPESRNVQIVLEQLEAQGDVEINDVKQLNEGQNGSKQSIGTNWKIGGNVKIGNVNQENRSK